MKRYKLCITIQVCSTNHPEFKNISHSLISFAVAEFRLCVGHDCLGTHLHHIGILPESYCMLCSIREPMDRNHLGQCTALLNRTECERYWEARIKMMENWLCFFLLLLFLWLLLTFRTFIFTLKVFSTYTAVLTFYFYWSHRSMMNSQCTCC